MRYDVNQYSTDFFRMIEGGPISENLGNTRSAQDNLIKSLAIWERLIAKDPENLRILINLARGYKQLSGNFGAQGNFKQALNYSKNCITVLEQRLTEKQSRESINLIGCYMLAAHWQTALGDYTQARENLFTAFETIKKLRNLGMFPVKLRKLKARIHEELAEVAAKTGDIESAVVNERKRLVIVQMLSGKRNKADLLADAYHALAARLAVAGDHENALQAYHRV